jgi:hypothetical protein
MAAVVISPGRGAAHEERNASYDKWLSDAVSDPRIVAPIVNSLARLAADEERNASDDNGVADPDSDAQKRGSEPEKGSPEQARHDCVQSPDTSAE